MLGKNSSQMIPKQSVWKSLREQNGETNETINKEIEKMKASDSYREYWKKEDYSFNMWCSNPKCNPDTQLLYRHLCIEEL